MQRSTSLRFTIKAEAAKLLEFINRVVERAYLRGYNDALKGDARNPPKISASTIRKFHDYQPPQ